MKIPRSWFVASTLVLAIIVAALLLPRLLHPGPRVTADPPAMVREIRRMSELVSVHYLIQKVVGLEEQKQPLGSEKILLIVQARVLGGVDLAEIQPGDVIDRGDHWVVRMPPARILHVNLDNQETRVWDRQITWWTPWVAPNPDLERQARLKAVTDIQAAALGMGILKEAQQGAENTLRGFLPGFGIRNVTFSSAS